jgi:nicotinamidase-related amidase
VRIVQPMILTTLLTLLLAGVAPGETTPPDTVVLLIDFQQDFASPDGAWPAAPELSRTAQDGALALVRHAHSRGWHVVRVANAFAPWDPGNLFRRHAAIRGRPGARWILPDTLLQGPLFSKTGPDGFGAAPLRTWFASHPGAVVWIAGFFTEGCVLATVKSALARGHTVVSSPDLVASVDTVSWRKGWARLRKAGLVKGARPEM